MIPETRQEKNTMHTNVTAFTDAFVRTAAAWLDLLETPDAFTPEASQLLADAAAVFVARCSADILRATGDVTPGDLGVDLWLILMSTEPENQDAWTENMLATVDAMGAWDVWREAGKLHVYGRAAA